MHVSLARRVEPVGRLVEHEQTRPGKKRGGKAEPLAHSEREAACLVVGHVGEPDLLKEVVDVRRRSTGRAESGQRGEVLPRRERGVQAGGVDEARDIVGRRERPPERRSQHLEAAAVGDAEAEQKAEQRRLPRSVRPDDPVDLPGRDIQVDTVERDDITESLGEPARTHRAGTARNFFSPHTANLQDTPDMWVDGCLSPGKR